MKRLHKLSLECLLVATAFGSATAFAAGAVYQKSTGGASIELTNIDEGDGTQAPVAAERAGAAAGTNEVAAPAARYAAPGNTASVAPVLTKPNQKKRKTNQPADDAQNGDSENTDVADQESGAPENQVGRSEGESGGASGASYGQNGGYAGTGGGSGTSGFGSNGGGVGGGSTASGNGTGAVNGSGSTASNGSASSSGGSNGTGSTSNSGTGSTASNGSTGTGSNNSSAGGAASGGNLDAALQRYRDMMLQAGQAQVTNPALVRRYIAVDRATYRGMLGL